MKKIKLTFALLTLNFICAFSQILPTASPYFNDGVYSVISDSTTVSSKKVVMYRPHLPPVTKYPVFIFQPGANGIFGGDINVHTYDLYLKHLVTYGFVVLVIDETTAGLPNGNTFKSVHTWFKTKVTDPTHWLYTYADSAKVIIGGHSNGGVNASGLLVDRPAEIHGIVYFASYPSDNILVPQDVSNYTGNVLSLAGSEDNSSTPTACKNGFNAYTSATCRNYALITGMGHGGFGDYTHSSQVVGSIGRENATATVRHYLLSFMLSQFCNDATAFNNLSQSNLQPNTTGEFISNCGSTVGLSSKANEKLLVIYPNPVQNVLNLQLENIINHEPVEITVYNSIGKIVIHIEMTATEDNLASLNAEKLAKGVYVLKINTKTQTMMSAKFIKQ